MRIGNGVLNEEETRVDLWKFGGQVKRVPRLIRKKGFLSSPLYLPYLIKNVDGTKADANAIFDLVLKKGVGRHHTNRSGLLFPVEYTPQLRLSLCSVLSEAREKERKRGESERDQRRVVFDKNELSQRRCGACLERRNRDGPYGSETHVV